MGFLVTALLVLLAVAVALYLFRKLIGAAVTVGVLLLGLLIIIHLVLKAEEFVGRIPASARSFLAVVDGPLTALVGIFSYAVSLFA